MGRMVAKRMSEDGVAAASHFPLLPHQNGIGVGEEYPAAQYV